MIAISLETDSMACGRNHKYQNGTHWQFKLLLIKTTLAVWNKYGLI